MCSEVNILFSCTVAVLSHRTVQKMEKYDPEHGTSVL